MCAPSEDSDQPGHPPSLIRVFTVRMKEAWVLSYPLSAQRRLWSDWADAQADLSLCLAHSHFVGFVMSWLIWAIKLIIIIKQSCGLVENSWDTAHHLIVIGGWGAVFGPWSVVVVLLRRDPVFYKACYSFYPGPGNFSQQYWVLELFFGKNLHLPHKSQMVAPLAMWFKLSSSCHYFFYFNKLMRKNINLMHYFNSARKIFI